MLDPAVMVAITSTVGVVVTGVIGVVGTIINRKLDMAAEDRKVTSAKREATDKEQNGKIDHLTVLSNSNLSMTNERLDGAMKRIEELTAMMLEQQKKAKDELVAVKDTAKDELVASKDEAIEKLVTEMKSPTVVPLSQAAAEVATALMTQPPFVKST